MSPRAIRSAPLTRVWRGYDQRQVDALLERVAAEVEQWMAANTELGAELYRIKEAVRGWQSADERGPEQVTDEAQPGINAVALLARAQQQADSVVAQAHEHACQVAEQARQRSNQLVREAQARGAAAAEQAAREYRAQTVAQCAAEMEEVERRTAWIQSFAQELQANVQAASDAFIRDVARMAGRPSPLPAAVEMAHASTERPR
jgi:DivIVA domain-containing protein